MNGWGQSEIYIKAATQKYALPRYTAEPSLTSLDFLYLGTTKWLKPRKIEPHSHTLADPENYFLLHDVFEFPSRDVQIGGRKYEVPIMP